LQAEQLDAQVGQKRVRFSDSEVALERLSATLAHSVGDYTSFTEPSS